MPADTLHIIIPCYNPPSGWTSNLILRVEALRAQIPWLMLPVTVVNDGSTRGVSDTERAYLTTAIGATWVDHTNNRGKGAALRTGVAGVNGACLVTDVDLPYTTASMAAICRAIAEGADVALGHRGHGYYANVPWARRVISKTFRWVLRRVMRFPISDTQCGLKGFSEEGRLLFLATTIDRFLFDMEFVMLASRRRDLRVVAVEAELNPGTRFSRMDSRILLREAFNFLRLAARGFLTR